MHSHRFDFGRIYGVACDKKLKLYGAIKRRGALYARIAVLRHSGVAEIIADVSAYSSALYRYEFLGYDEGAVRARRVGGRSTSDSNILLSGTNI